MECLRVLVKDYKNAIEDILVAEKQLQKELIYDMQKYEAAKARSTVQYLPCGKQMHPVHQLTMETGVKFMLKFLKSLELVRNLHLQLQMWLPEKQLDQ